MSETPKKKPLAKERIDTPEGAIRKGNRKPFRKCTEEQRELRISRLCEYMRQHPLAVEAEFKRFINKEWGLSYQRALQYITLARTRIRQQSSIGRKEIYDVVIPTLLELTKNNAPRIRAIACRELIAVAEAGQPRRVELTGAGGGPVATKDETPRGNIPADRLRELLALSEAEDKK